MDFESETFVTHSLRADGFDASEDGTGRGTPLVPVGVTLHGSDGTVSAASYSDTAIALRARTPGGIENSSTTAVLAFSSKDCGADAGELAPTLRSMNFDKSHANAGGQVAVAIRTANTQANGHGIAEDVSHTLDGANGQAVAFTQNQVGDVLTGDVMHCLNSNSNSTGRNSAKAQVGMALRRLTPRECERLQGFPDDYTRIPIRFYRHRRITKTRHADRWEKVDGGWMLMAADGPRYKVLGNSMAVLVMRWIGERIQAVEALCASR